MNALRPTSEALPWRVEDTQPHPFQVRAANGTVVAVLLVNDAELARLIAAAPDLLRVLQMTPLDEHRADERGPCLCSQCEFRRAARAAIANATSTNPTP